MTTLADAAKRPESTSSREAAMRAGEFRLSESPSHLLRRAEQYAAEIFLRAGTDGVTLRQTVLLAAIAESEGASQSGLVTATGIDRSTLAEMMARMESKGLIARTAAADDNRAKSVKLTREGRNRMEAALPAMRTVDQALLRALPRSRRTTFTAALAAIAGAADESHREDVAELRQARRAAKKKGAAKGAKTAKGARKKSKARRKK
jgi:DNA-binding MarR family transcriptional regulator